MSEPTENTRSIQLSPLQTDKSQNCEVNSCSFNPLSFELICYASKANWSNRFQIMNSLSYFTEFSFLKFILIIYVLLGNCPFFSNLALYWHKIVNMSLITIVLSFAVFMCFFLSPVFMPSLIFSHWNFQMTKFWLSWFSLLYPTHYIINFCSHVLMFSCLLLSLGLFWFSFSHILSWILCSLNFSHFCLCSLQLLWTTSLILWRVLLLS